MKLKDLLLGREKLRKYDELKEWKEKVEGDKVLVPQTCDKQAGEWAVSLMPLPLPTHIKDIVVKAIEAEIAKLDEE